MTTRSNRVTEFQDIHTWEAFAMIFTVELLAFSDGLRLVEIPDHEALAAALTSTDHLLELVFKYGQNDVQPKDQCSVSVGDVIRITETAAGEASRYLVLPHGFREIEPGQHIPQGDGGLWAYQQASSLRGLIGPQKLAQLGREAGVIRSQGMVGMPMYEVVCPDHEFLGTICRTTDPESEPARSAINNHNRAWNCTAEKTLKRIG
jgi:hypothetical protein